MSAMIPLARRFFCRAVTIGYLVPLFLTGVVLAQAQDPPFTLIGQTAISGTASDVALRGDYAYVCSSSSITIVNVSNPENPLLVKILVPGAVRCEIDGDLLTTVAAGPPFTLRLYSLTANPETPALLGSTTAPYHFPVDLLLSDTHAYVAQLLLCWFIADNNVFSQHGDLISIDIGNTASPALDDVLFNTHGTSFDGNETPGCGENGGSFNIFSTAQSGADTLLLTSTTATGTDTQTGSGRIRVADISNPSNLAVIDANELQIPSTVQTVGIAVQGDRALVSASTGGWNDMDPVSIGLTGNIVLAVLDVSDADAPELLASTTLDRASIGVGRVSALSNNRYVFSSLGFFNDDPHLLYLVDASDPGNLVIDQTEVPEEIQRASVAGNLVYTESAAGLLIYRAGGSGVPAAISNISYNGFVDEVIRPAFIQQDTAQVVITAETLGLPDPQVSLKRISDGGTVAFNDNCDVADIAALIGRPLATPSQDACIVQTLSPDAYFVEVTGTDIKASGDALAGVTQPAGSTAALGNISYNGFVAASGIRPKFNVASAGQFVITAENFGLPDPQVFLKRIRDSSTVAFNDDCADPNIEAMLGRPLTTAVDASILVNSLAPGAYFLSKSAMSAAAAAMLWSA